MVEIINDLDSLRQPAEPLEFISESGIQDAEGKEIIEKLHAVMAENTSLLTLAAPQIGINKRIFCIRFDDTIKTFIDPIIIKKNDFKIAPETFSSMPGKEILISRPEEITVVYYTADFKYEENKLLGAAARLFDQQAQLLDGVLPDVLGLVSDVATDGSLADLSDEEIAELAEFYKNYVKVKTEATKAIIDQDPDLASEYRHLEFSEKVVNGKAALVAPDGSDIKQRAQKRAMLRNKAASNAERVVNKQKLNQFLKRKGK
jgi:peptide deformylase